MTVTRFMPYPPVPATTATMGYNVGGGFTDQTVLDYAKAGGATIVRTQASWGAIEDFVTGALSFPAGWEASLAHCGAIGLKVILIAGYGPPVGMVPVQVPPWLQMTVHAPIGSKVLSVSGDLTQVVPPYAYINKYWGVPIVAEAYWSYQGSLIDSVNPGAGTVTLAAPTNVDLPVGTPMFFQKIKYPALNDNDINNPGVLAFVRYAKWLADRIAANGCTGYVELWNEYPWAADRWDSRSSYYDVIPGGVGESYHFGSLLHACLNVTTLPAGVRFINGITTKGGGSVGILQQFQAPSPTPTQIQNAIPLEGQHPYGNYPEAHLWDPASNDAVFGFGYFQALNPQDQGSAFRAHAFDLNYYGQSHGGTQPGLIATEAGGWFEGVTGEDRQAVFTLRRVASLWGVNMPTVIYALIEGGPMACATGGSGVFTPKKVYTALNRLMTIVSRTGTGLPAKANALPTIIGCPDIPFPPMAVGIYGSTGAVLLIWQRTFTSSQALAWDTLVSPAPVNVPLALPSGFTLAEATDVVSGNPVTTSTVGNVLTVPVTESPRALRFA